MNKSTLSMLTIAVLFMASCGGSDSSDDNDSGGDGSGNGVITTPEIVNFASPPSSELITSGPVEVITEDTVRYHVINLLDGNFTSTMIETATGLIIVDVGPEFIENAGTELRTYADAISKPISIIMTHNHLDHWGNMASFSDIPVYSHDDVAPLLMETTDFTDRYPSIVNSVSSSQDIGGLTFTFDTIQNAETGENGYVYIESIQAVFVADLVYNRAHNFIREYSPLDETNEVDNWVDGLGLLRTKFGEYNHIFCGHNGTRTDITNVIDENILYLTIAQELISGLRPLSNGDTASTVQEIIDELLIIYPDHVMSGLMFSLPGVFSPDDPGADWFE